MSSGNNMYKWEDLMKRNSVIYQKVKTIANNRKMSDEDAFKEFVKTDSMFNKHLYCPQCDNNSENKVPLKYMSIRNAELHRVIEHSGEADIYFVICPECLWEGRATKKMLGLTQNR